jgi:hypothetical protein
MKAEEECMNEKILRDQLIAALSKPNAHLVFEDIADKISPEWRAAIPQGFSHSPWQLLEHLRIAQWDILEFSRNPDHKSPSWPEGYWPDQDAPRDDQAWANSVRAFQSDLSAMIDMLKDESIDLFAEFPHGDGQNLLREVLLLAKHNSYHLGQLAQLGKVLSR